MAIENGQRLKSQLEQQGALLAAENDPVKAVRSLLNTCAALLHTAEALMPENPSPRDLNSFYAGYLGIVNRVGSFCTGHADALCERALAAADRGEAESSVRKNIEALSAALEQTKAELNGDLPAKQAALEKELTETRDRITNFQAEIERLTREVGEARENYGELKAGDEVIKRICEGIEKEGYVDIASFNDHIHEMNETEKRLAGEYNTLLNKLSEDVETLQNRVSDQIKPTAK